MNSFRFLPALAVTALVFATALASDTFTLKRAPKVGDTATFTMTADLTIDGQELNLTGKVTEKVVKADDKEYTVESVQSDLKLNGTEVPMSDDKTTSTYTLRGMLVSTSSEEEGGEDGLRLNALQSLVFPEAPVKIGESYTIEMKAKEAKNPVAVKGDFKVEAMEKIGQWEALKISFEVKETEGSEPASAKGTIWVDPKDGQMVKYEATWTNAPFPMIGAINAKMKLERV